MESKVGNNAKWMIFQGPYGGSGDAFNTGQSFDDKKERSLHIRNYPENVRGTPCFVCSITILYLNTVRFCSKINKTALYLQVSESDIQSLFFPYGKVRSVRLFRDKGFGFVEFTDPSVVDYILQEKVRARF